ncbi:MAG: 30S ribosomal protein S9 [Candidatus Jacksonbacteria bacterium]|nr:30S ribosomal protein S9 [Candidatus Jacksonbacteria bacterium]
MSTAQISRPQKKNKYEEIFEGRVYTHSIGRRKTGSAQARLYEDGKGRIYINEKEFRKYFPYFEMQKIVTRPLDIVKEKQNLDLSVKIAGGGTRGQADAASLAIARVIAKWKPEYREKLKQGNLLKTDDRVKERKKPGLKRARRAPQWAKR